MADVIRTAKRSLAAATFPPHSCPIPAALRGDRALPAGLGPAAVREALTSGSTPLLHNPVLPVLDGRDIGRCRARGEAKPCHSSVEARRNAAIRDGNSGRDPSRRHRRRSAARDEPDRTAGSSPAQAGDSALLILPTHARRATPARQLRWRSADHATALTPPTGGPAPFGSVPAGQAWNSTVSPTPEHLAPWRAKSAVPPRSRSFRYAIPLTGAVLSMRAAMCMSPANSHSPCASRRYAADTCPLWMPRADPPTPATRRSRGLRSTARGEGDSRVGAVAAGHVPPAIADRRPNVLTFSTPCRRRRGRMVEEPLRLDQMAGETAGELREADHSMNITLASARIATMRPRGSSRRGGGQHVWTIASFLPPLHLSSRPAEGPAARRAGG